MMSNYFIGTFQWGENVGVIYFENYVGLKTLFN